MMLVLVFNSGSSSLKYQLYSMPGGNVLAKGMIERIGEIESMASQEVGSSVINTYIAIKDHHEALGMMKTMLTDEHKGAIKSMSEIGACGHRVVHGGESFSRSVPVNEKLEKAIEDYADLAPLHNPQNLAGIQAAREMLGDIPQIACFDTAFHQTIQKTAYLYALPLNMYEKYKIRRYGFHGISHRYVARRTAEIMGKGKYDVNLITCHLGNGSSITAVGNGKSMDTSMGLTPLEGVAMGTRTGDLDPAVIFYLVRKGYNIKDVENIFNKQSGLRGISGTSNDVRDLEEKAEVGDKNAQLALDIFAYKVRKYIGAYMAVLDSVDGIVFTGGIGTSGVKMRERILQNMNHLGIQLNSEANKKAVGIEAEIHAQNSAIEVFVIPTDEESAIAKDTYEMANDIINKKRS